MSDEVMQMLNDIYTCVQSIDLKIKESEERMKAYVDEKVEEVKQEMKAYVDEKIEEVKQEMKAYVDEKVEEVKQEMKAYVDERITFLKNYIDDSIVTLQHVFEFQIDHLEIKATRPKNLQIAEKQEGYQV